MSTVSWNSLAKPCNSLLRNQTDLARKSQFAYRVYGLIDTLLPCVFEQSHPLDCLRQRFGPSWISVGEPRSSHFLGGRIGYGIREKEVIYNFPWQHSKAAVMAVSNVRGQ